MITKWEAEGKLVTKDFDAQFWSRLRKNSALEHIFNNKCAYCETDLGAARQPGDADHYRPKGLVNYKTKPEPEWKKYKRARAANYSRHPANELNHPGYFWLAYNWKNLLPACKDCNSGQGKF